MDSPMTTIEPSLAAIFAICDHVADSGDPIRTEDEGREAARAFLGQSAIALAPPTLDSDLPKDVPGG